MGSNINNLMFGRPQLPGILPAAGQNRNQTSPPSLPPVGGQASQQDVEKTLAEIIQLLQMVGAASKSNFQASQAMQAKKPAGAASIGGVPGVGPAAGVGNAAALGAPQGNAGGNGGNGGKLRIAQIDNFSTDNTGFNHGQEIAKTLNQGGNVDLLQFEANGSSKNVAGALQNIAQRVQNGEKIDAVNISMADFQASGDTQQVKQLVDQLSQMGVPVVIAAGNNGAGSTNQYGTNNAFVVQSATNGQVNGNSGRGNVTAEGRTTSFATANLAVQLAQMKNSGMSLGQMKGSF